MFPGLVYQFHVFLLIPYSNILVMLTSALTQTLDQNSWIINANLRDTNDREKFLLPCRPIIKFDEGVHSSSYCVLWKFVMRSGKTSYIEMDRDQEIEHGELDEEFKCRVTRPLVPPLTPIDPDGEGRMDYDIQLMGWDADAYNIFDRAHVSCFLCSRCKFEGKYSHQKIHELCSDERSTEVVTKMFTPAVLQLRIEGFPAYAKIDETCHGDCYPKKIGLKCDNSAEGFCPSIAKLYTDCLDQGKGLPRCRASGEWGPWTTSLPPSCDIYNLNCHSGLRCRYRFCENPYPAFSNQSCVGNAVEVSLCRKRCKVSSNTVIIIACATGVFLILGCLFGFLLMTGNTEDDNDAIDEIRSTAIAPEVQIIHQVTRRLTTQSIGTKKMKKADRKKYGAVHQLKKRGRRASKKINKLLDGA